ncbi:MAG: MFS transporter [Clostridia bacterium]|nr:MFS transporter [Clostridia bacterium]
MKSKYLSTKLACYCSYIVQAVINNFLPILFIALQDIYGLGYEKLARIIVFSFVPQIFTDFMSPKIVSKIGYRYSAFFCQALSAAGLFMLAFLPRIIEPYTAIILSVFVYALGSGLIEVVISNMIGRLPTDRRAGNMSVLHSFFCWGQMFTVIVTTVLLALFGFDGWNNIPLIWAVIPFVNMFCFLKVPIVEEPFAPDQHTSAKSLIKSRKFRCYMIMMFCAGACEIAMADWASMFVQQALGVSKVIGDLTGPCSFALFMGVGRIWYAAVSEKISFKKTLIVLCAICFVCYNVVAFCNIPAVSLVFCGLCGFTVSIAWPGIYAVGAGDFAEGKASTYSILATCGDTGCCLGPWILGIVADYAGLNIGFGVVSVFPLILIAATLLSFKSDKKIKG